MIKIQKGKANHINFGIFLNNDIRKLIGMQRSKKLYVNNIIVQRYERRNWQ
jgi:hypothetical protein